MEMLLFLVVLASVITFVLVLVVVGRLGAVKDQLGRLTGRIERLTDRVHGWTTPRPEPYAPPPEVASLPAAAPETVARQPAAAEPVAASLVEPAGEKEPVAAPRSLDLSERPLAGAGASAESLETAIGQKWLVRIGALVLVVGAGFFYAYAIEQRWVTEPQRAVSGGLVGLAVVGLGIFFNRRGFAPLAQGFVGCGAGILFLDAFASHHFYHLIDARVALLAMAAVTALTAAIALRWSAMPLVLIALLGGYLAPVLLDDQRSDRALVVFAYVFVIDAGFLLAAAVKRWRPVEIVAAVATPLLFLLAILKDSSYPPEHVTAWAYAFALLFLGMAVGPSIIRREAVPRISSIIAGAASIGAALVAEASIASAHPQGLAMTLAALGVLHAACAEGLSSRVRGDVVSREVLRLCGAALVLDALRFPFGAPEMTVGFAVAGVGLALAARGRDSMAFRAAAAASFVFAIGRVLAFHLHGADTSPSIAFQNADFAVAMAVAGALGLVSLAEKETRWVGLTAAALLGVIVLSGEVSLLITQSAADRGHGFALVLVSRAVTVAGVMVGFTVAARRAGRWPFLVIAGLHAVTGLALFAGIAGVLQRWPQVLVLNPICIGSLFVPLAFLAAAWILGRAPAIWPLVVTALAIAGTILPLVTLSIEAHRFFAEHPLRNTPVDAASAAVSVTWALYAAVLLSIGISKRLRGVRLGALALLGITLIKVVVSDLAELDRLARIVSFIALGVVLMSGAWAYHRFADRIFGEEKPTI